MAARKPDFQIISTTDNKTVKLIKRGHWIWSQQAVASPRGGMGGSGPPH